MFVKIWLSEASSVCTQRNVNNLQIDCKMFKLASLFIKQCKQLFHIWWHFLINHDCDHTVNKLHKCVRVQCAHVAFHAHPLCSMADDASSADCVFVYLSGWLPFVWTKSPSLTHFLQWNDRLLPSHKGHRSMATVRPGELSIELVKLNSVGAKLLSQELEVAIIIKMEMT